MSALSALRCTVSGCFIGLRGALSVFIGCFISPKGCFIYRNWRFTVRIGALSVVSGPTCPNGCFTVLTDSVAILLRYEISVLRSALSGLMGALSVIRGTSYSVLTNAVLF